MGFSMIIINIMRISTLQAEKQIQKITKNIANQLQPVKIILFGSFARGDYNTVSDLDLCVIMKSAADWFTRTYEFKQKVEYSELDIEPHIYTEEEFAKMIKNENPLAMHILKEGKVLYEQQ